MLIQVNVEGGASAPAPSTALAPAPAPSAGANVQVLWTFPSLLQPPENGNSYDPVNIAVGGTVTFTWPNDDTSPHGVVQLPTGGMLTFVLLMHDSAGKHVDQR